jgi:hypothetical protein
MEGTLMTPSTCSNLRTMVRSFLNSYGYHATWELIWKTGSEYQLLLRFYGHKFPSDIYTKREGGTAIAHGEL